jgi:hypothetical protein
MQITVVSLIFLSILNERDLMRRTPGIGTLVFEKPICRPSH